MSSFTNKFALLAAVLVNNITKNFFVNAWNSAEYIYYKRSCPWCICGSWEATDYRWCVEDVLGLIPSSSYGGGFCDQDKIVRNDKFSTTDCVDRDE